MKKLLSGNEAIARGAYEAGIKLAAAYPGTPSTEILENVAKSFPSIYAEWAPNEKVAFEVGIGASLGGGRTMVTMKHVGLNVAADPLMTFAYTGVGGGFVLVSADDPEMHSSQNEQDNRLFAKFAQIPFLEPSDQQEAKDFVLKAAEISEEYDTPVMLRVTTRISHSKGTVEETEPVILQERKFERDISKYVMVPGNAQKRRYILRDKQVKLQEFTEETELNIFENNGSEIGIITGGVSYQYAKEICPDVDYLKIGFGYPLPIKKIRKFVESHKQVIIVEELEPYYQEIINSEGMQLKGKEYFGKLGELTPLRVSQGLKKAGLVEGPIEGEMIKSDLFPRPPVLCPGCPHRSVFMALKKLDVAITGDIGCYTLAALPPLNAMDSCVCMGASIGKAIGMEKVNGHDKGVVAVIGDSTFLHSGMTGLLDAVYNKSSITVVILDNRVTAMTGGQEHPATGHTLMGEETKTVNLVELCKSLGVDNVIEVDPYDYKLTLDTIKEEVKRKEPSVVITNRPCVLMPKRVMDQPFTVDLDKCNGCSACFRIGCPAIMTSKELTKRKRPKAEIDPVFCTGCSICVQICKPDAIVLADEIMLSK